MSECPHSEALARAARALAGEAPIELRCARLAELASEVLAGRGAAITDASRLIAATGELAGLDPCDPIFEAALAADAPTAWPGEPHAVVVASIAGNMRRGALVVARSAATLTDNDRHLASALADVLGLALAHAAAEASRADFRRHAIAAQEEERRHIARELHDGVGQALTALLVGVRTLDSLLPDEASAARELARRLGATAVDTLDEVGRLARGLRPSVLDDVGLVAALERHVSDFSRTHGVRAQLHTTGMVGGDRLPPEVETTIYRVVQEALTNVARHARARSASVIVERRPGLVAAIVEDDGLGMPRASGRAVVGGRLGLVGIEERVALLGGQVEVESTANQGTTIYVKIPLAETKES